MKKYRLSQGQKAHYREKGYVKNLKIFNTSQVSEFQNKFTELISRLPSPEAIHHVNNWHKCSPWFYNLCQNSVILDYVEDALGRIHCDQWSECVIHFQVTKPPSTTRV